MDDPSSGHVLRFGRFELDRKTRELRKDGLKVRLQDQPFHVLALLLERPGDVVTREELRERLWPADTFVDFERGLNNAVRRLRDALGDSAEAPRFVDTLPRVGYRFITPVEGHGHAPVPAPGGEAHPPPEAPQGRVEERPPRSSARARRVMLGVGVVIAAGAAVLAVVVARPRRAEPPAVRSLTYSGHDSGPSVSPDGRLVAFASDRDGRRRIWLAHLSTGEEAALTSGPDDTAARFSPDGASLLFTRVEAGVESLYRTSVLGEQPRRLLGPAGSGDWSPDRRRLAYATYSRGERPAYVLGVAGADGSQPREIALVEASWMSPPRWSPDGRLIAVTLGQGSATASSTLVLDPLTGQQRRLQPPQTSGALSVPVWSREGHDLLFLQSDAAHEWRSGRLLCQTLASGRTETLLRLPAVGPGLDRAGPGRLLFDAHVVRLNLREHPLDPGVAAWPRWLTRGHGEDRQPSYSPDGERVIFVSNRSGNPDLWEVSLATGRLRRLTDHPAEDVDPHVLRDGRILWASSKTGAFELWIAEPDGSSARQVTHDGLDAANPVATPDGGWIFYTARQPDQQGLWRIRADGSRAMGLVPGRVALAEISPDGEHVLFAELEPRHTTLRVVRLSDTRLLPFKIELAWNRDTHRRQGEAEQVPGQSRFMPDGRAVAFFDVDEGERSGIVVQDFDPGRDTSTTRRPLAGFDPDLLIDSFALSPDGRRLTIAYRETSLYLMVVEGLTGVRP